MRISSHTTRNSCIITFDDCWLLGKRRGKIKAQGNVIDRGDNLGQRLSAPSIDPSGSSTGAFGQLQA